MIYQIQSICYIRWVGTAGRTTDSEINKYNLVNLNMCYIDKDGSSDYQTTSPEFSTGELSIR